MTTANIDKAWFERRMAAQGLSMTEVARRMKLDKSALSRALSGKRQIRIAEVAKLATVLQASEAEVWERVQPKSITTSSSPRASGQGAPAVGRSPGFGFMKGLLTIEDGYDLTSPSDEDWENGHLDGEARNG
jgi:transcriptional regulator with XRE-family HTH domain